MNYAFPNYSDAFQNNNTVEMMKSLKIDEKIQPLDSQNLFVGVQKPPISIDQLTYRKLTSTFPNMQSLQYASPQFNQFAGY